MQCEAYRHAPFVSVSLVSQPEENSNEQILTATLTGGTKLA